jgi:hypothetical protein
MNGEDRLRRNLQEAYEPPLSYPTAGLLAAISASVATLEPSANAGPSPATWHGAAAANVSQPLRAVRSGSRVGRPTWLVLVAAALALALVATVPVAAGTSPLAAIPRQLLAAAGLTPVVERLMPTEGTASSQGETLSMIGTYADDARTVVIVRIAPLTNGLIVDDQYLLDASGKTIFRRGVSTSDASSGYNLLAFEPVASARTSASKLTLYVTRLASPPGPNRRVVDGNWVLQFSVSSQGGSRLPTPEAGPAGQLLVNFESVTVVPGAISIVVVTRGALPEQWASSCSAVPITAPAIGAPTSSPSQPPRAVNGCGLPPIAVFAPSGRALDGNGLGGASTNEMLAVQEVRWSGVWPRTESGLYRIVVTAPNGDTLERSVTVP